MKRKVLISFVSALLAFQSVCHGLTFVGVYQDIEEGVNKIGTNFRKNNSALGLVGYFDIDDVKDIPIYRISSYLKPSTLIPDNVCVLPDSADVKTIANVRDRMLGIDDVLLCKLSEIGDQLDNIKRLQKETPARSNILPSNQTPKKPKTSIIKPVLSVGLVATITTIASRVFYDTKIKKQKNNAPQSKIQKKTQMKGNRI